ncbi:IS3 family transposase [Staphylococcus felis]|uniref:IS3 family transposase n=3 Tax=Staphylococcus felis TaxID=46127 RepID=A0ABS0QSB5_9STAP|nr:IS3 family transposase [Staphylococcus felis]AVP35546.1 IS3 family transposase [Staphylococcus felis]AVP35555.1 IS3 family transposase [Staphylococcus felis]AVP35574.1 IS3 family transposase [Staphylococcus felis]AVP35582.1 IS3 family transposase [Staphylococcus felis]AVP35589.1 IS3 family transposase [Staphylococcus felis]
MTRERRTFSPEFKLQMVKLYENGKPRNEIAREYDLTPSALGKWIKQHQNTGSFNHQDNLTNEEKELRKLRKENQQLKMENDIFKASSADHGTKIDVIRKNANKYSVSAMCKVLQISRSSYYYEINKSPNVEKDDRDKEISDKIIEIFNSNRKCFGTRRIKNELIKNGLNVSRRRIGRIMKANKLVSSYTTSKYKSFPSRSSEREINNELNQSFNRKEPLEVLVSDLTYVKVAGKWHYICLFIDLFNREIVGHSAGSKKDSTLVSKALSSIRHDLRDVQMFHTDRGKEFDNHMIDDVLDTFGIKRSLSMKGCPYDNAVAESTFKALKTEFIKQYDFKSINHLKLELFDYVNWYNNIRPHSALNYLTPKAYKDSFYKNCLEIC